MNTGQCALLNLTNRVEKSSVSWFQLTSKWFGEQSKQLACPPSLLCISLINTQLMRLAS